MKNAKGFTFLEILIAITILATLMAFTSQSVIRSSRDKVRLQGEIDRDSRLTNALRIIERDVNLAFHHRQLSSEIEKDVKKTAGQQGQGQPPTTPGGAPPTPPTNPNPGQPQQPNQSQGGILDFEAREYPQLTQFIATENKINFTSLSHVRTNKDSQESDQQEVGYYLEACDKEENGESIATQCLWRRSTPYIDEDVTKGGGNVLLLSGVKELKFRYYGDDKLDWVSAWRTDEGGDEATKDKFPLAVEVTLSVVEKDKESSVSTVIPILFPNNIKKEETQTGIPNPNPNQPQQPNQQTGP